MLKFFLNKLRTLRWFIFLAVFFSTFIVFIGVTSISSLLYESLMDEQANQLVEQLEALPEAIRPQITLPNITTEVRLTYIGTFALYSFIFLIIAFIFSHFAIRKINQSIKAFSQQINQIQTGQDLQNFNPTQLNFIFNELNLAFNNISALARQLGQVLNDKSQLEVETSLLSKLVIKNTRLDNWQEYIKGIFIDIHKTLAFDFISVYLTEKSQPKLIIYWFAETDQITELEAEKLLQEQLKNTTQAQHSLTGLSIVHQYLTDQTRKNTLTQPSFLVSHLEKEPQIGFIQGIFIHSPAMNDLSLRLRINSLLVLLVNLLGASRAISGYTQKLETAINLSEQENAMAAEVLYGHLLVKNTDQLAGINYQICSSSRFSGDVIQVKRSPSGSTFILVADATGHGLSATITVMPVISVFNAMVQKGYQLPFILSEMNKHLVRDLPDDRFVAALLIEINPSQQEVSIWNGAMPPALLMNNEGQLVEKFNSKNMALGILDEAMFESTPELLSLPKDGQLFLYSDGLIEQENPNQKAFGYKKLINALQHPTKNNTLTNLINSVLNFAQLKEPDDDISLCQIDFTQLEVTTQEFNARTLLCDSLDTPFEWQMKIYGSKLAKQSLPALCNEFMQAQGLSMPLKRWAFNVVHELVQLVIETNLLELPANSASESTPSTEDLQQVKRQALENLSDDYYLNLKFQGSLKDCNQPCPSSCIAITSAAPCLLIEVSDNAKGKSSLVEEASLASLRALSDQVIVSEQGHCIQVRVG
ncbi:PP2C family protein-serine/threonine phosphatase [Marinospirillum insulare]|uniref:PPM-type phosphatase domain-containing protein n=1 Tax=Marinospirillum insulare TaxID=217169 RepID=A0ABQ5ZVX6_9GAMM|nr:PP2C family protein-serine/threonine phosphatase [Marinospirillum insulare]GLR64330.1 hypothetical protein GCM10007878_17680 [Marinospirillum insulare]